MQTRDYTAANGIAWDEIAPRHREQNFHALAEAMRHPSPNCLDAGAAALLKSVPIAGKSIAHLCCNNGRELVTLKKHGAGRCVGFDISKEFVAQASELASIAQADCTFVASDVFDIDPELEGTFDIVLVTIGALGWMPDLPRFFGVVAGLLKARGVLVLHEQHPIMDMFDLEDREDNLTIRHSYFRDEPFVEETGLDYYADSSFATKKQYWFHHTMAGVLNGCIGAGLTVRAMHERPDYSGTVLEHFARQACKLPLSYTLLAQKA